MDSTPPNRNDDRAHARGPREATLVISVADGVALLNDVLVRRSLSGPSAAAQLHLRQAASEELTTAELNTLSAFADLLVRDNQVNCNFSKVGEVLWQLIRDARQLLKSSALTPAALVASQRDGSATEIPVVGKGSVGWTVQRATEAATILAAIESHAEVRRQVSVSQSDLEDLVFVSEALVNTIGITATDTGIALPVSPKPRSLGSPAARQVPLSRTEFERCQVALWALQGALSDRKLNIKVLLALFNSPLQWKLSGVSLKATSAYCSSLSQVLKSLLGPYHRAQYADAVKAAAILIATRITERPPLDWVVFQAFAPPPARNQKRGISPDYALLSTMSIVCRSAVALLGEKDDMGGVSSTPEAVKQVMVDRAFREVVETLRVAVRERLLDPKRKAPLSFHQLAALATINGMPRVELADDEGLRRRAISTRLCASELLDSRLLRVLVSMCYTIPKVRHATLTPKSALALVDAVGTVLLQSDVLEAKSRHDELKTKSGPYLTPVLAVQLLQLSLNVAGGPENAGAGPHTIPRSNFTDAVFRMIKAAYTAVNSYGAASKCPVRVVAAALLVTSSTLVLFGGTDAMVALQNVNPRAALLALAKMYAVRSAAPQRPDVASKVIAEHALSLLDRSLKQGAQRLSLSDLHQFLQHDFLPHFMPQALEKLSTVELARVGAYFRALSTPDVFARLPLPFFIQHMTRILKAVLVPKLPDSLKIAALSFYLVPFSASSWVSPLLAPGLVKMLIVNRSPDSKRVPPMSAAVLKHFARRVRMVCEGLQNCNFSELRSKLNDPKSDLCRLLAEENNGVLPDLKHITPTSAQLLIASALFDSITTDLRECRRTGQLPEGIELLSRFSALVNLLQCSNVEVIARVSASIEIILLDTLQLLQPVQQLWFTYLEQVVETMSSSKKAEVTEWLLALRVKLCGSFHGRSRL